MSKVELETSISDGREGKDARPGGLDRCNDRVNDCHDVIITRSYQPPRENGWAIDSQTAMERRERAVRGLKVQDIIMEPDSSEG